MDVVDTTPGHRTAEMVRMARGVAMGASAAGLCLLESPGHSLGNPGWNHLLLNPVAVFKSKDGFGRVHYPDGTNSPRPGDPFRIIAGLLQEHPECLAAGYWGYDLRHQIEKLPSSTGDDLLLPDCHIGLYAGGLRQSAEDRRWHPFGTWVTPAPFIGSPPPAYARGNAYSAVEQVEYEAAVRQALRYIAAGDCYQVNLSQRLHASLVGPAWSLYEQLRRRSPAPYAAYLDCGDHQVLSSSPELFLRVRGREVETRPIKGTRPRGATPEEDAALRAELLTSAKDAAELLMIVDLERNDLGRVCEFGSVHVPALRELESYRNVHHLVATVRGRLRPEIDPLGCLRALFPGGSITGAPKIRAMEIIEELEPLRRGVYTGAIGWVDAQGNGEWNIAIRTMVVKERMAYFQVGGGIVADSDPESEFLETLTKARGMLRALHSGKPNADA
jgi:para-aminobenzoate synthetase component 1